MSTAKCSIDKLAMPPCLTLVASTEIKLQQVVLHCLGTTNTSTTNTSTTNTSTTNQVTRFSNQQFPDYAKHARHTAWVVTGKVWLSNY